jgi:hypothetical protein
LVDTTTTAPPLHGLPPQPSNVSLEFIDQPFRRCRITARDDFTTEPAG